MVQVTVDPLSRIEGHYRINTEVDGDGVITDAQSSALLLRGFEKFLMNQDPRDAALLTQRICGVCPVSHSIAAANALDELFGVVEEVPQTALVMRNIHQGLNFIASHAAHIYILWGPDLANPAYHDILMQYGDTGNAVWGELAGRFMPIVNQFNGIRYPAGSSYLGAIGEQRNMHDAISLVAGKMPHAVLQHVGGVVYSPTIADINELAAYVEKTAKFVEAFTLGLSPDTWIENTYKASSPQKAVNFVLERLQELLDNSLVSNDFSHSSGWGDVPLFAAFGSELVGEQLLGLPISMKMDRAGAYPDPDKIGFLSYGVFFKPENGDGYDPTSPADDRVIPSGYMNGNLELEEFDYRIISESINHSFYIDEEGDRPPWNGVTVPERDPDKIDYTKGSESRYSWAKAPNYGGIPCEVGPLARLMIMGEPLTTGLVQAFRENGYSPVNNYTRMIARMQEVLVMISELMKWILQDLEAGAKVAVHTDLSMAKNSTGMGLWEAPRGALGHWIATGSDSMVTLYQAVVPSTWNLAPRNSRGIPGPVEQALIGTKISAAENALGVDYANPLGILHTGRSYDPCLACAVHTIDRTGKHPEHTIRVL
ncbi:Methanophenazine hydrogenase large subunit [Methanosarcina siciliae T4/M]|uniref:Methanophenazine hydrogenase large subunit n=2 Tax=Methanosarcina siciliae TaxID=38027 RepID=A0A0E3LAB3_9EURY|nr:nickel-dependent hydrogenase large subunit [Methanosarcina siciliae]AKB27797.1 Methanophenazine hydrogenase large subunit [Methanosarcina siciliae T4/M]AKB31721.1 Methanophenazine hydrogenase large subunit [Methanosarcina siciliae HI350]